MNSALREYFASSISLIILLSALSFSSMSISQEIDIKGAQTLLNTLGYEAGSEDGFLGPSTQSALELFQKEHSIPITGLLDNETEEMLAYRLENLITKKDVKEAATNLTNNKSSTDLQNDTTALSPNNSEANNKFNLIDLLSILIVLSILYFIVRTIYRAVLWVKRCISNFFSLLSRKSRTDNQNKYDIKAEQIPQADDQSKITNRERKPRLHIQQDYQISNSGGLSLSVTTSDQIPAEISTPPSNVVVDNRNLNQSKTNSKINIFRKEKTSSWVPFGTSVKVKGFVIDGLVYVGAAPRDGRANRPDNSFIDPTLSLGKVKNDWEGSDLPYWPNYSELSPTARATYLNWLSEGRTRVVNPGYLFLYFYGLERRYFKDKPTANDRENIIIEVVRLRKLFHDNRSVSNYLGIFLDAASLAEDFSSPPEVRVGGGLPLSLKVGLARRIVRKENIQSDWLLAWYLAYRENKLRTPARRCPAEFTALFDVRFDDDYPNGMQLKKPKRQLQAIYEAASGQFSADLSNYIGELPDISSIRSPLTYAEKIVESVTNELNSLSRLLAKNEDARSSILAHSLLPKEIRHQFPCEELVTLGDWAHKVIAEGGIINSLDLIEKLTSERPEKLTRKRLIDASDTLLILDIGVAPDPRFALRSPKDSEPVVIFVLPEGTQELEVSDSFRMTSLKLGAATMIAQSDNEFLDSELAVINSIVANAEGVNAYEKSRLHATARWMQVVPPDMTLFRRKVKLAPKNTREVIASLAVEVVVADGDASVEEVKTLESLYKALELDPSSIHSAIHSSFSNDLDEPVTVRPAKLSSAETAIPKENSTSRSRIGLDLAKIKRIDNSTREVSSLLQDIFSDQTEEPEKSDSINPINTVALPGLSLKLTALAKELAIQNHWSEKEFEELVSRHGAMPAGAVEAINEWSFDTYDTAYLDEYNGYDIDPNIAAKIGD